MPLTRRDNIASTCNFPKHQKEYLIYWTWPNHHLILTKFFSHSFCLIVTATKWQVGKRSWRSSFNLFSVELADPSGFFQKKSAEVFWCHDIQQSDTQQSATRQNDVQKNNNNDSNAKQNDSQQNSTKPNGPQQSGFQRYDTLYNDT